MYEGVKMSVRKLGCDTNDFAIDIGLHQGSTLRSFLFIIIIDELTKEKDKVLWSM